MAVKRDGREEAYNNALWKILGWAGEGQICENQGCDRYPGVYITKVHTREGDSSRSFGPSLSSFADRQSYHTIVSYAKWE